MNSQYVERQLKARIAKLQKWLKEEQLDIQHKPKPIERRLGTLKKHIEQTEIYFKYKGKSI